MAGDAPALQAVATALGYRGLNLLVRFCASAICSGVIFFSKSSKELLAEGERSKGVSLRISAIRIQID
jgi:hypothetical protein